MMLKIARKSIFHQMVQPEHCLGCPNVSGHSFLLKFITLSSIQEKKGKVTLYSIYSCLEIENLPSSTSNNPTQIFDIICNFLNHNCFAPGLVYQLSYRTRTVSFASYNCRRRGVKYFLTRARFLLYSFIAFQYQDAKS